MPTVKIVSFELDGKSWMGLIITVPDTPLALMVAINLETGKSYQMQLPGF